MQGAGGANAKAVSRQRTPRNRAQKEPVALSHAECHRLLTLWAAVELSELRKVWYPCAASGYRDYEPPRDPEARQEREIRRVERDWHEINRTGWCVFTMLGSKSDTQRTHAANLLSAYKGGDRHVSSGARRLALDMFGRVWGTWSEAVDKPLNPL